MEKQRVTPPSASVEKSEKIIYLLSSNAEWGNELGEQLNYFNYKLKLFNNFEQLKAAADRAYPSALIIDLEMVNKPIIDWIRTIKTIKSKVNIPIIYTSDSIELTSHLQAVRNGGDGFFTRPIDVMNLAIKLDLLCGAAPAEPYRILIVEDTVALSTYFAFILQQAGMHTLIVNQPLQIIRPLIEFKPDLILMDLYMPGCTGIELATVIRQQDAFTGIPIIYLSSEEDKSKQILAMGFGGDDFLTKPIVPEDLIAIVQRRAQRARLLCSLIVKDSLTGLLNHASIKERLQGELARAERQKSQLAFAMIDLDNFKAVNDIHGHQVGDLVITHLCRLLIKRLRRSDIAGRYGGEEFSLILPDTDINAAYILCDQIREDFSQIRVESKGTEFNTTFSCGIATYPAYQDLLSLTHAADTALYEAKETGRNKVIVAKEITNKL